VNMRYTQAPGEAEAELAFLNRTGVIDAVLSDDVDTFVFGGMMVIRKCVSSVFHPYPYQPTSARTVHCQGTARTSWPVRLKMMEIM
jgi:hypothetical protein